MNGTENLWDHAFELAYFVHPNIDLAVAVVGAAVAKVPQTVVLEDKRASYAPSRGRTKVLLNSTRLLQYHVLLQSEVFQIEMERKGAVGSEGLIVGFISHIARRVLSHNSFYACIAVTRVLCDFKTSEALDMYAFIDENCAKVEDECRRVRSGFFRSLEKRFGNMVEVVPTERGEKKFIHQLLTHDSIQLTDQCLKRFTPWGTRHVMPDYPSGSGAHIAELSVEGKESEGGNYAELSRMHVFLDPECFGRLLKGLNITVRFEDKLMIPKFGGKTDRAAKSRNSSAPPKLGKREVDQIRQLVAQEEFRRKLALSGPIRVRQDGTDVGSIVVPQSGPIRVTVSSDAELLELVGTADGGDVVLATYILGDEYDYPAGEPIELVLPFPGRQLDPALEVWPEVLLAAVNHLISELHPTEWTSRLRHWADWLQMQATTLAPPAPPFGFAAELRGGALQPNVYDLILSPDNPICRFELISSGEVLAGVEPWPEAGHAPLVLLVSRDQRQEAAVRLATMDPEAGLPVARFPDVKPGRYVVCLEPVSTPER